MGISIRVFSTCNYVSPQTLRSPTTAPYHTIPHHTIPYYIIYMYSYSWQVAGRSLWARYVASCCCCIDVAAAPERQRWEY